MVYMVYTLMFVCIIIWLSRVEEGEYGVPLFYCVIINYDNTSQGLIAV